MKDALVQLVRTVSTFLPASWQPMALTIATTVAASSWGDDDPRWRDVVSVVNESLRDIQEIGGKTGSAARSARAAAELKLGRELRRLGLVEVI